MAPWVAVAGDATEVLYIDDAEWQRRSYVEKLELAASFMRIFCTTARMEPAGLIACVDGDGRSDMIFARAMACSAALS